LSKTLTFLTTIESLVTARRDVITAPN